MLLLVSLVAAYRSKHGVINDILMRLPVRQKTSAVQEGWFTQKLDHFSDDSRTWKQRYFLNKEHYKPGGPVFLMIGGEGEISSGYVSDAFMNGVWAKDFKGATVALEHRFYGKSLPLGDLALDNLRYLTSRQALADLDHFQHKSDIAPKDSKWVCMGGSYPGNLAAWYKQKYPNNTVGCFAFSAPVKAKVDFFEYGQMVHRAIEHDDTKAVHVLMEGYNLFRSILTEGTYEARKDVYDKIHACPYSILSQQDHDNAESSINTILAGIVQYNNTGGVHIEYFQRFVDKSDASPLDTAINVYNNLSEARYHNKCGESLDCVDFSIRRIYEDVANTDPQEKNPDAAWRSWAWQTCNEFGYFQTSRQDLHKSTLYTTGNTNPALNMGFCTEVFHMTPVQVDANVAMTNEYYGGLNAHVENTVFINGEFDPWSELSHRKAESGWVDSEAYVIDHGSHCIGLYAMSSAAEHPGAAAVQEKLRLQLKVWLASANQQTRFQSVI